MIFEYSVPAVVLVAFLTCSLGSQGSQSSLFLDPQFPVRVTNDLVFGTARVRKPGPAEKPLLLDLYEPDGNRAPPLRPGFVAVHGGGLVRGDKRTDNMVDLCRELAARGYVCLSVNYRLTVDDAPAQGGTPLMRALNAAIEDSARSVAWLRENASRYKVDPNRIAGGGSSAGAHIMLRLTYGDARPRVPTAAVFSWVSSLEGDENIIDAGEPPLFIVNGADDDLVPAGEALALARRAAQVGLPHRVFICEGLGHNVPLDRRPAGISLYRHLAEFLWQNMDLGDLGTPPKKPSRTGRTTAHADTPPVPCPH